MSILCWNCWGLGNQQTVQKLSDLVRIQGGCLVCVFKQPFSIFKQHFTHFNILFYPHVFLQMFSNNNFQFLNKCIKRTQDLSVVFLAKIWLVEAWLVEGTVRGWFSSILEEGG